MKKLLLAILLAALSIPTYAQRYVFFLHNMYVELYGLESAHPEYGRVEYYEVLDSFKHAGFTVVSEVRPKGTNGNEYAKKVASQVDSLLKNRVPPSHVTVVGTSKGGYIAMLASSLVKNDQVRYVFIGCCGAKSEKDNDILIHGKILSIYEKSDMTTSCKNTISKPGSKSTGFKEILLNTGRKHGFLYKALPEWILPTIEWAKAGQ